MEEISRKKGILKKTYLLPSEICNNIEKASKEHDRNINEEIIFILKEYFSDGLVKLDPTIKNAVEKYARNKGITVTEAVNYLVSTKISVMEWIQDTMGKDTENTETEQFPKKIMAGSLS
jgi:hypothetical protein